MKADIIREGDAIIINRTLASTELRVFVFNCGLVQIIDKNVQRYKPQVYL